MLQTSARLLQLLTLLQGKSFWSGADLCERLEVTDRTLRRDVDRLRTLGYPVDATSGPAGGYALGRGTSLPPLMFDDDEATAVALALQTVAGGSIQGIDAAAARAQSKLEQVLPQRLRRRLKGLRESLVRLKERGPRAEIDVVDALAGACADQVAVRFAYADQKGKASQRHVEPHRLVHTERRWYLVAFDVDRDDWRTFRVDRVVPPVVLGDRFAARAAPDDDLAGYLRRGMAAAYPVRARLVFHAPLAAMQEQFASGNAGTLEAVDEARCRLHTSGSSVESIAAWLGYLGRDFDVEEPHALREALRAVSDRLARAAAPGERSA
jgi:predicted DNA-binding transcriptional regulator YafY